MKGNGLLAFAKVTHDENEIEVMRGFGVDGEVFNHSPQLITILSDPKIEDSIIIMKRAGIPLNHLSRRTFDAPLHISDDMVINIACQLIQGIAYLHGHGVAHLDVKPDNLLLDPATLWLTIADFSLAEFERDGHFYKGFIGTEGETAPEVGEGLPPFIKMAVDVWACGRVVFNLSQRFCADGVSIKQLLRLTSMLGARDPRSRPMLHKFPFSEYFSTDSDSFRFGNSLIPIPIPVPTQSFTAFIDRLEIVDKFETVPWMTPSTTRLNSALETMCVVTSTSRSTKTSLKRGHCDRSADSDPCPPPKRSLHWNTDTDDAIAMDMLGWAPLGIATT